MKFILGKKLNMTQIFAEDGKRVSVSTVAAGPCYVTQIKTKDINGYDAAQIGFGEVKETRLSKPERGHLKKSGKFLRKTAEFRISADALKESGLKIGGTVLATAFQEGERVQVTGVSKGKGFQGVVRRHGFSGSPATHGHKDQLRMPGSIGATNPQRVTKGKKMAGRMGNDTVTVKNLQIIKVDGEKNILYIKGAIPGARGAFIKIKGIRKM